MAKTADRRRIRCYLCGHGFEVSARTMSVPCPRCHKAIKVEDVVVKSYMPVNDMRTCGSISVSKSGRVVARIIQSGEGIECEGALEGVVESEGAMTLGPKSSWKGPTLVSKSLEIADGAKIVGHILVPWTRPEPEPAATTAKATNADDAAAGANGEAEAKPPILTSSTRRPLTNRSTTPPKPVATDEAKAQEKPATPILTSSTRRPRPPGATNLTNPRK